ncbi:metalloregulator ArsR/SmtB family transcription factor [Thermomonas brevis]
MPQTVPNIDPEAMRANAGRASALLKALASDKRLMILCLLVEGERSVGELNARLDLSQPALSQHLKVLRDEGLVDTRRDAQSILYSLVPGPAQRILQTLHDVYCGERPLCDN